MKNKELREKLERLNDDYDVCIGGDRFDDKVNIHHVTQISAIKQICLERWNDVRCFKEFEKINEMVRMDLSISSPECCEYTECHHFNKDKYGYYPAHFAGESGGLITRYYEDDDYARAYCCGTYDSGIVIAWDKKNGTQYIFALGEDDGSWFLKSESFGEGYFYHKNDFVACISEALAIFKATIYY